MEEKLSTLFHKCAYDISYQQAGDSVNYAFVEDHKTETLYIYYQGSNSISDWVRNFLFPSKPYKDMDITFRVHRGFLAAWKEVKHVIRNKITEQIYRSPTPEEKEQGYEKVITYRWKHIIVVGYSHGGSLTFFTTEMIWYERPDLRENGFRAYAFESPRVLASYKVSKKIKERWDNMTVIRTGSDIVTHCPPWLFGFTHTGNILKLKGDVSLAPKKWYIPKCLKYHYPEVVYDALLKSENNE